MDYKILTTFLVLLKSKQLKTMTANIVFTITYL